MKSQGSDTVSTHFPWAVTEGEQGQACTQTRPGPTDGAGKAAIHPSNAHTGLLQSTLHFADC